MMGGDTNIVEDALDRLPSHPDNNNAVNALDELKTYLGLVDGWRETYPTTCAYTYHQAEAQGGAQSRIDRFYVKRDLFEHTFEWGMQSVGIETDHRMITARLTSKSTNSWARQVGMAGTYNQGQETHGIYPREGTYAPDRA
jgi:exonuclease III